MSSNTFQSVESTFPFLNVCGGVHHNPIITVIINVDLIVSVDLIENEHQSHGKRRVEAGLDAESEDVLPEHRVRGGVNFAFNLSH